MRVAQAGSLAVWHWHTTQLAAQAPTSGEPSASGSFELELAWDRDPVTGTPWVASSSCSTCLS